MNTPRTGHRVRTVLSTIALFAPACGSPIDPAEGGFGDSASYSGSETGGKHDVGPGMLDPGECIADAKAGVFGYKYQCGGVFVARIHLVHDGEPISFFIPAPQITSFGDGHEPYEHAKVMACCGEFDRNLPLEDQPPVYVENCLLDFRQQACTSIAVGLAALINDGKVPKLYEAKAIDIQHYIAQHTEDCVQALLADEVGAPYYLQASWHLPDDGPWAPQATGVRLTIDTAWITDMYLPDDPDPCEGLGDNVGEVFSADPNPLPDIYDITLDEADGGLFGPNEITGSAAFASLSTACADPYCSVATFSTQDSEFSIDRMQLHVAGDLRVTNGDDVDVIANARLELYSQAFGKISGGGRAPLVHTVEAGAAQFVVVGQSAGEWVTIPVLTSTPIVAHEHGGAWSLETFSLAFVDDGGGVWTMTVGASEWL
jgi:hypothetical protein